MSIIALALTFTLLIEVPTVALFYKGCRTKIIVASIAANIATNVAMNVLLVRTTLAYDPTLLAGETVALLAEAAVYAVVDPKHDLIKALTASAAANLASFGAGLVLLS